MKDIALKRGGKCLLKKYINNKTVIEWQCKQLHSWPAIPSNIIRGHWCPECSTGLGERICRIYFEVLFGKQFIKFRPNWLINSNNNQMELDGYCAELQLAFEHHGLQHYQQRSKFQTTKDYEKRTLDDVRKRELCEINNITLIVVPQIPLLLNINKLQDFILKKCKDERIMIAEKINENTIDLSKAYNPSSLEYLEEIKNIAINKKGKCFSSKYLHPTQKLQFQCHKGHIWPTTANKIKKGQWCPKCAKNKKGTIEEMKQIAILKGGICLSEKYVDAHTNLKWQCIKDHTFDKTPAHIKRGQWCSKCRKDK